jgi:hypothetical protein
MSNNPHGFGLRVPTGFVLLGVFSRKLLQDSGLFKKKEQRHTGAAHRKLANDTYISLVVGEFVCDGRLGG